MPVVTVKYELERDVSIDTIYYLEFSGKAADLERDKVSATKFKGKVENVTELGFINVATHMQGLGGSWSLRAEYSRDGIIYKKLNPYPIEDDLVNQVCIHDKDYPTD